MTDFATQAARRVMAALGTKLLTDPPMHHDVFVLANEILAPSAVVPVPEDIGHGVFRWTGASGWTVKINRFGDVYVSDSRIPAAERITFVGIVRAAHALAAQLPDPHEDDDDQDEDDEEAS